MIFEEHQTGMLDCLGQVWTWVSGESVAAATLVGVWANVIQCRSSNSRIECKSSNQRIECKSSNARIET